MSEVKAAIRCFANIERGKLRRGVWVMTDERQGVFIHGDRNEMQSPRYPISELIEDKAFVIEVPLAFVLSEISEWPEARKHAISMLEIHQNA